CVFRLIAPERELRAFPGSGLVHRVHGTAKPIGGCAVEIADRMRGGKRDHWRKAERPVAVGEARNGAFLQVGIPGIDIRLERELREKRDIPHASELQVAGLPPYKIVEVFSKGR